MFLCQHMLEEGPDWKWFVPSMTIPKLGRVAWGQDHLVRKHVMACESISDGKKDFWINPKPAVACQLEGSCWSTIMTESSFCFRKWDRNSDTDCCINVCLKWIIVCLPTPLSWSWWSELEVMAASQCYSWWRRWWSHTLWVAHSLRYDQTIIAQSVFVCGNWHNSYLQKCHCGLFLCNLINITCCPRNRVLIAELKTLHPCFGFCCSVDVNLDFLGNTNIPEKSEP